MPIPVAESPKTSICGLLLAGITVSNPARGMNVSLSLSVSVVWCQEQGGRRERPLTHAEESYWLWCVVCDLGAWRMRRLWPALGCLRHNNDFISSVWINLENVLLYLNWTAFCRIPSMCSQLISTQTNVYVYAYARRSEWSLKLNLLLHSFLALHFCISIYVSVSISIVASILYRR
jgi:hypothetical protein